jgi:hypothetical protein
MSSPVLLPVQVHPAMNFTFSSQNYPIVTRPSSPTEVDQSRAPSLGFFSSSRQLVESTNNELPTTRLTFRPQRFSHSRRFSPPQTRGLISSHNHVQDSHSKGFPRCLADQPFDYPFPLAVSSSLLPTSKLVGAKFSRPPSGLSSVQRSVVITKWVRPNHHPIPSCAFTSAGFSPNTLSLPSQGLHS